MDKSYWKSRWRKNNIGWHMDQVYPHLITYWHCLKLDRGDKVLVPLAGKSLDMRWIAEQGCRVIGVEISPVAVRQFFEESNISSSKQSKGHFTVWRSNRIDIYEGDFLKLDPESIPSIDAIYDKAALIAFPEEKRKRYARKILEFLNPKTRMLLNSFEYKQDEMNGPPFAVFKEEIDALFGSAFRITLLHEEKRSDLLTRFQRRGLKTYLKEKLYLLHPKTD